MPTNLRDSILRDPYENHAYGPRPAPGAPGFMDDQYLPSTVDPFQGFTPTHAMEGFDYGRLQDPNKSAKDAFAYFSNQAPPPPLGDKNALNVWFSTYIRPGMQKLGHNVTDVQGDKFRFNNWQGDFWVDYGRGAGAPGGALAWQADYAQGGPANQAYSHTQRAIMGTPSASRTQQTQGAIAGVPRPQGATDLGNYYQYLQSFMNESR